MKIRNQKLLEYLLSPRYDSIRVIANIMPLDFIDDIQDTEKQLYWVVNKIFQIENLNDDKVIGIKLASKLTKFLKSLLREMSDK